MSQLPSDSILSETLERVRRAELATVLHPPSSPEHARAVARLDAATRQMHRLEAWYPARTSAPGAALSAPRHSAS